MRRRGDSLQRCFRKSTADDSSDHERPETAAGDPWPDIVSPRSRGPAALPVATSQPVPDRQSELRPAASAATFLQTQGDRSAFHKGLLRMRRRRIGHRVRLLRVVPARDMEPLTASPKCPPAGWLCAWITWTTTLE